MSAGMSPEEFQDYLGLLSRLLRLRATQRRAIEEELRVHLEDRLAALTAQGVEPKRAVSMALAEFGDAAALAAEFAAVSRIQKRRWMMRLTIGSLAASAVLAAALISLWPGGPAPLNLGMAQAQQPPAPGSQPADPFGATQQAPPAPQAPAPPAEESDANAQTLARLEKSGSAEFQDTPLQDVLDYLADFAKVQFFVDQQALTDVGLQKDTPVTFNLKDVPVEMILRLMLEQLDLGYRLDHGVVIVSTQQQISTDVEIRVYRVDDLVEPAAKEPAPAEPGGAAAGGGGRLGGVGLGGAGPAPAAPPTVGRSDIAGLITLIQESVEPTTWDAAGGPGTIREYRGAMVISQTGNVHRKIEKLLEDLRKAVAQ